MSRRAGRRIISMLTLAIALVWLPAPAGADEAAPPPPDADCGCACAACPPPPPPSRLGRGRRQALLVGAALLGTGYGVSVAHAFAGGSAGARTLDLVPVAGAMARLADDHLSPAWTAALVFSAWSQSFGLLVLAIAGGSDDLH